jgi:hypothetical protein
MKHLHVITKSLFCMFYKSNICVFKLFIQELYAFYKYMYGVEYHDCALRTLIL